MLFNTVQFAHFFILLLPAYWVVAGRTTEAVFGAMRRAFELVTPQDIRGWFRSCGLCATQT